MIIKPLINCARLLLAMTKAVVFSIIFISIADATIPETQPRDLPEILASGYLRVAMLKTDEIPFFYQDKDGKLTGIDVELMELLVATLGVRLELNREASTFNKVVDRVAEGKADLGMSYLSVTLDRAKRVSYTNPYALNFFALAINRVMESQARTRGDINLLLNNPETRLGVQMGSTYELFARRTFPQATLIAFDDAVANAEAAGRGDIHAAVSAQLSLAPMMQHHPTLNFRLRTEVFRNEPDLMAPVVHPQSHHLLNWMNTFLQQQEALGVLDKIRARHGLQGMGKP